MAGSNIADEVVDWPRLEEIRDMVDPSSFSDILDTFASASLQHLESMELALTDEDFPRIRQSGHALRGGSGNLGAIRVAALAMKIETAAVAGDQSELHAFISAAKKAVEEFGRAVPH